MKSEGPSGKFILVKRRSLYYRISVKDLKGIKVRSKKILPRVPSFEKEEYVKDIETEDGSTAGDTPIEEEQSS